MTATAHHEKIFRAIEERDLSLAKKTADEHLGFAEESLNQILNTNYSE
jgi:DNA-binding FadR family transcriptional regulator